MRCRWLWLPLFGLLATAALPLMALNNIFFGDKLVQTTLPEFKAEQVSNEPERFYLTALDGKTRTALALTLTRDTYADSRACRQSLWTKALRAKVRRGHIRQYDYGKFAVVEWESPSPQGVRRNITAYYAVPGLAMTVRLVRGNCPDGKVLLPLLDRLAVGDVPPIYRLCFDGKAAFDRGDYRQALEALRPALEAENRQSELRPGEWRDLVVWTGVAEAMEGRLQEAEHIFAAALRKDPKYPLFHYNLACVHAERGELPAALAALEQALRYRDNISPGQTLPQPLDDPSFRPFRNDPRLLQLLRKYARTGGASTVP
ncbi:MAG: tetratricopeptide repeat protein [Victivallales bacterium]|nr:tetratricopeptide repeat protein [Victivallales bacterium]